MEIRNGNVNNAKSSAQDSRKLNSNVCIQVTDLYIGGAELHFAYDSGEIQNIVLTKDQAEHLGKQLLRLL